jgi:hypothetical protein
MIEKNSLAEINPINILAGFTTLCIVEFGNLVSNSLLKRCIADLFLKSI